MKFFAGFAAVVVMIASQAQAQTFASEADRENYFTVDSVEVREAPQADWSAVRQIQQQWRKDRRALSNPISDIISDPASVEAWVTLGEKLWQVVVNNKPVANVASQRVSVLPQAQLDWQQMEHWQGPLSKTYIIEAKNLYGMSVVSHAYTIAYNYGGQLNGKGQFIANATIIPSRVQVVWGYTLNSKVEVAETVNMGTKENPLPGIDLQLQWSIDTVLKHAEGRDSYFVRGDGETVHVNGQN